MNIEKKPFAIGLAGLLLAFASASAWAEGTQCENSFTVKDGLFNRKVYKTLQDYPIVPIQAIYRRAYKSLIKDGWVINLIDKEGGVISASQLEGSPGEGGKVATLNLFIENAGKYGSLLGNVRVTTIFSVPGALQADEHMVRMALCSILGDIK